MTWQLPDITQVPTANPTVTNFALAGASFNGMFAAQNPDTGDVELFGINGSTVYQIDGFDGATPSLTVVDTLPMNTMDATGSTDGYNPFLNPERDLDGDGFLDDVDGDGIADTPEVDADGDGMINSRDTDSDNDGTTDREEVELDVAALAALEAGTANSDGYLILADDSGLTLDFDNVTGVSDLQYVDMSGTTDQTLTLSDLNIASISDSGTLTLFGDENDTVNVTDLTSTGEQRDLGGTTVNVYQGLNGTELLVEDEVAVI